MSTKNQMPWLDVQLTKKEMNYLWDSINSKEKTPARESSAANISRTYFIKDTNNKFFNSALQNPSEALYFRSWENFSNVHVTKVNPPPIFHIEDLWVNYQKKHEFNPPHRHEGMYSFVVFMKIPTHWKEQHELPIKRVSNIPCASDFQFILGVSAQGLINTFNIPLNPEDEGRMLFFPSWLTHQVFPFYGTEEERVTISGNIVSDTYSTDEDQIIELENTIKHLQTQRAKLVDCLDHPQKKS